MKKYIYLLLAMLLCLFLVSCGSAGHDDVAGTISGLSIHGDFSHRDDDDRFQGRDSKITLSEKPTDGSDQTETEALSDHNESQPEETQQPTDTPPENSTFAIHFIDVGQADAALVLCDGEAMLIDGGNAEDSNLGTAP